MRPDGEAQPACREVHRRDADQGRECRILLEAGPDAADVHDETAERFVDLRAGSAGHRCEEEREHDDTHAGHDGLFVDSYGTLAGGAGLETISRADAMASSSVATRPSSCRS